MQHIKEAVIAAWEAAWDSGEVDAFDAILHDDYRRESRSSRRVFGAAELKQEILDVREAFPDLRTIIDRVLVDEEHGSLALFWRTTGTFTNDLQGVPASGRRVETRGSNLMHIRDGRIVSEEVTWDQSELLADLGVPSLRSAFEVDESVVDDLSGVPSIDALKGFNRQFITGVTVVTTLDEDGRPRGLAANSYSSVSLDPPLVSICVQKTTSTYPSLFKSTHLGINIMSNGQRGTVGVFASKGADKFAGLDWHEGPAGSPLIDGSAASIEAEIKERFQAKTHTVFIAKVTHAEVSDAEPMVYKAGRFFDGAELTELPTD
ncbi:flavin reductase [Gulosibacter sp. 10]|uniref:flavin reductase n=1 Tax=Gulosibacter sp. 10 TaxID=1255570 RepID=UPI00097F1A64|nr:flavin reductase [Gulosibacter sp. 10]SJM50990.1 Nitrilotriacetate monooxygenase component B [Gulosibacter sp. 10]